ncbi:hypothetical protein [Actinomyces ruminis]|uniref:Uncharacterized protein n=1 Tax=Actinomyces ruminis TaxID=1937003 RepID=A0ABX4MAR6_9ACTO|nr:hypothetical protein [Actinomyces ruminis]PHP52564.1 hypothetical protein BW737_008760 [Actinomyces ruminis]
MSDTTPPARVPFWKNKRFWVIAIPVILVLGIIGSLMDDGEDKAATELSTPAAVTTTTAAEDVTTEAAPETTEPEPEPTETEDSDALDAVYAMTACEMYGEQVYPYGFKLHSILASLPRSSERTAPGISSTR